MRGLSFCLAVALVVWAMTTTTAIAATDVTVRVTDRQGQAISDVSVGLTILESETPLPPWMSYPVMIPPRRTGLDGQATFVGLKPGVYAMLVASSMDTFFVSSMTATEGRERRFTVRDEPRLTVPVILDQGDRVTVEFRSDVIEDPPYEFAFIEEATGARIVQRLSKTLKTTGVLPPGRWRFELTPPHGLVFRSLEIDGVTAPRASDVLEITEGGQQRFVTVTLTGPCMVDVQLTNSGGEPPGVLATQIDPGPLSRAATAVGAPPLAPLPVIRDYPTLHYHSQLPDGIWRIAPKGDLLESSDPPFIDIDCTSAPHHAIAFDTRTRDGDGGGRKDKLTLSVTDPNDEPLNDAVVEVYLADAAESGASPIATGRTTAKHQFAAPVVVFEGLPRKKLLVVAGHDSWIDESVIVPANEPDQPSRSAVVRLKPGATIDVDAIKPDGTPAPGMSLKLSREDTQDAERTTPRVWDPTLRERKRHPAAKTDATGRATIRGIEPGHYVARGASDDARYIVQVREDEKEPEDTLSLSIKDTERIHVTIVLRAAATIVAELACDDKGALPLKVDARLLAPDRESPWRTALPVGELLDPLYKLDGQAVGGSHMNRLRLGPLKPGVYALAIRPRGFDRWSFAGGGEDPTRSMTLQLDDGQELDLGVWTIPCRPSVLLVPQPIGAAETDVSHATATSTIAASAIRVDRESSGRRSYRELDPFPLLRALRLYGVPDEPVTVGLQVRDRFLLPSPLTPLPDPIPLDLDRGREQTIPVQFESLAGSVDVAIDAPAARAIAADGTAAPLVRDTASGQLRAGPLRPGLYSVEVCADLSCTSVTRRFEDVTVTALSVTVLPPKE